MEKPFRSELNFDSNGKFKKIDWNDQYTPLYWLQNDPIFTYLGNMYIVVTKDIEQFTIKVTKTLLKTMDDSDLKEALKIFIDEEMAHAYQHSAISQHLCNTQYPIKLISRFSGVFFRMCLRRMGFKSQIAFVLAMEFCAHELSTEALEKNHFPKDKFAIYDFIRWHAIEELTHSKLCFDLYDFIQGGYFRRILTMLYFSLYAFILIVLFLPLFYVTDCLHGRRVKSKKIISTMRYFYGFKGLFWKMLRSYLKFYKPSFKPTIT